MTRDDLTGRVLTLLGRVAPEADLRALDPRRPFRDQFDFDSMDFLNLLLALGEEFKIEIPEVDLPKLASLDGCVSYLADRLSVATRH